MKLTELKLVMVETMPEKLELGTLYISLEYQVSIHLCACGECGQETVLPLHGSHAWVLGLNDGKATFSPSIGNFQFPCKSHYFIRENRVEWC